MLGSEGFFKFKMDVKPEFRKAGTIIKNHASISFDFNDAVTTNTHVFRFVTTATHDPGPDAVSIFPNPCSQSQKLHAIKYKSPWSFIRIFNLLGLQVKNFSANQHLQDEGLDVSDLPTGNYLF